MHMFICIFSASDSYVLRDLCVSDAYVYKYVCMTCACLTRICTSMYV